MKRSFLIPAAVLFCAACSIGPKYQRPVAPAAPAFKELAGSDQWKTASPSDANLKGKWWEMFGDPQLNHLEEMVSVNNQTVKQAEAQFRSSTALARLARAGYFPTIGSSPSITASATGRSITSSTGTRLAGVSHIFQLPFSATWEPDLWGRVRLSTEFQNEQAQSAAALIENARLSIQSTLAQDYFNLLGTDMQIALLNDTIAGYETYLALTINRYKGGVAAKSDVTLAQTQLETTRAEATDLYQSRTQFEHALAVLTGRPPSELELPPGRIAAPPPTIPTAVPSQLLERRPDIASGERLVASANANIGIAQTAFYPTLTLAGSVGVQNTSLMDLFTWPSRVWSVGPTLAQTLFDFGRRKATVQEFEAQYDAQVAAYRQTVLSAFQEVEDNLAALRVLAQEAVEQDAAVAAAQQSLVLETDRYKAGTDTYLNVITTQQLALSDERSAVTILQRRMVSAAALVAALGGGWDASTLPSGKAIQSPSLADPATTPKIAQPPATP
jgi:NodT family efflux transporter outer membrane factor (OMF) lipoprotein